MNKKIVNIGLLVLLLSGCNSSFSKREPNGEPSSKNAPLFIRPNTNASTVNKPNTNEINANKPAVVQFNAEKYLMVKESDLGKLVEKRTTEALSNIKKEVAANTNENPVNKEVEAAIDNYIKKPNIPDQSNITVETVKLEPQPKSTVNPLLSFFMTFIVILAFVLAVGYFFFFKKKNVKSSEAAEPVIPNDPPKETPAAAAKAAPKIAVGSPIPQLQTVVPADAKIVEVAQGASQAATLGVTAAVVSTVIDQSNQV